MKFEVYNRDGKIIMNTTSVECIPDDNVIKDILSSGYKIKIDGKVFSKEKLKLLKDKR